jgi:hypothetical protein
LSFAVESKQRPGLIETGRRLCCEEINSADCGFLQKTADGAIQFKSGDRSQLYEQSGHGT